MKFLTVRLVFYNNMKVALLLICYCRHQIPIVRPVTFSHDSSSNFPDVFHTTVRKTKTEPDITFLNGFQFAMKLGFDYSSNGCISVPGLGVMKRPRRYRHYLFRAWHQRTQGAVTWLTLGTTQRTRSR